MGVERMDCRNWDEDAYRESILGERESLTRTIFRATFAPNANPNPNSDHIATASSDGSIASYSISSCLAYGCGAARGENRLTSQPNFLTQGHDGPAYDVKFYGEDDDSLLLSCGDDGRVRGWNWKEIIGSEAPTQGGKLKPVLDLVNPQPKGPWGALSPIPEDNAIAVDCQRGSIYAAAGDSRAYCWDAEKCEVLLTRMIAAISWVPKGASKSVPALADPPSKQEIEEILKSDTFKIHNDNGNDEEYHNMDFDASKQDDEVFNALAAADALGKASNSSKLETDGLIDALKELDMDNYDEEDDG